MNQLRTRSGISLDYRVDGPTDRPAVVMVNSIACDSGMWQAQVAPLTTRFRVVRYDPRGHGNSDVPPPPYSLDELGHDLVDLLNLLEIPRAHICGISLGGMVAMWLAARHPARVKAAVLASTAARIGTPDVWEERIQLVHAQGMAAVRELVLGRFFTEEARRSPPSEAVEAVTESLSTMSNEGYVGCCYALRDADLHDLVPKISAPSLIVAGENDISTPIKNSEWLRDHIPDARLVVLKRSAHLCNIEKPHLFNDAVLNFLTDVEFRQS